MKSSLTVLLLVLAISAVPAIAATLDSQYLVVLGRDSPSSDAILGANFAASMKGTVAVTFSSAIDTQLYEEITDDELRSKTIVVIDGEERRVKILGTSNAAAAADTYFSRMGFETQLISSPSRDDVLVKPAADEEPETEAIELPEPQEVLEETVKPLDAELTVRADTEQEVPQDVPSDVPEEPPQQSVFTRVFAWFRGLF